MKLRRRRVLDPEIAPDEIFLDASNVPAFDRMRFEGRIEQPLSPRTFSYLSIFLGVIIVVLVSRAAQLEIVNGTALAAQSAHNSLEATEVFAPRGVITDRNGIVLVQNADTLDGSGIQRKYLMPSMGQIIGYVSRPKKDASGKYYDTSQTGLAGIEAEYNDVVSGRNGRVLIEKDVRGGVRSSGMVVMPREGQTLQLSLDANLQKHLAGAIAQTAQSKGFIAGAGVVMDIETGEVLAIVSYPSYDPNVMSRGSPAETIAAYNAAVGHPFLDHAVQGVYAPGSIVKPMIAAGALTDGLITRDTTINDLGFISLPDPYHPGKTFIYKGWKALGAMTVENAIAWSSDIFFYTIGGGFGAQKGLGIDRLAYWYRQFGFENSTGIDLPGEVAGRIPTPEWKKETFNEPWYLGDTYFTAIGQYAMQVTPIQAVRAVAAIANDGRLVTPRVRLPQATEQSTYTAVPASAHSLAIARAGMREAVVSALAQQLNVPYVSIAAKTGTAQTGTRNQYDNSWVIGFFPYEQPRYAFSAVLERGPEGSGSQAVNALRTFFDALAADASPYLAG